MQDNKVVEQTITAGRAFQIEMFLCITNSKQLQQEESFAPISSTRSISRESLIYMGTFQNAILHQGFEAVSPYRCMCGTQFQCKLAWMTAQHKRDMMASPKSRVGLLLPQLVSQIRLEKGIPSEKKTPKQDV